MDFGITSGTLLPFLSLLGVSHEVLEQKEKPRNNRFI